jgi:hypothetical protein
VKANIDFVDPKALELALACLRRKLSEENFSRGFGGVIEIFVFAPNLKPRIN